MRKFNVGQNLLLAFSVGAIPAGTGVVVTEIVKEGCEGDYIVRTCGVDLTLVESDLIEPVNSSTNSGAGGIAGADGKQSDIGSTVNGGGGGTGLVEAGQGTTASDYSVAQAVSDLEALAYGVGFEKDEYILDIAEKLKKIAA